MSELKAEQEIVDTLKNQFGDRILEATVPRKRRVNIKVADPDQVEIFKFAKKHWKAWHMIAISGVDTPEGVICCVYHFDIKPPFEGNFAISMNLRVDCDDHENPKLQSVVDVIPGAHFFERETHDLVGIFFEGNPGLERLILPEDFPEGVHPLRKDFLLDIQKEEAAEKAAKRKKAAKK
jgi:NADH-quinone oxidoreductase subunit C